ncbi:unnamed protein product [Absidia cylindrospora]
MSKTRREEFTCSETNTLSFLFCFGIQSLWERHDYQVHVESAQQALPLPLCRSKEWPERIGQTSNDNQYFSDNEHGHPHFTRGNTKQMKRYAEEILQHERSTIHVTPDGTVIITPHPRPLPNEIVAHIISYVLEAPESNMLGLESRNMIQQQDLCTCMLVNKQFYAIAYPLLWQEPVLELDLQPLLDCLAATTKQPLGHKIKRLHLDNTTCTDTQFLRLMPHIPRLTSLSIDNIDGVQPLTSTSLQHVPRSCSQLTSLTLSRTTVLEATIHAIGQHCHQLTELNLKDVQGLRDDFLSALSPCPLKEIYLCLVGPERILTDTMVTALARFQDLQVISLSLCEPSHVIMMMPDMWPRLTALNLDRSDAIDDTTFIAFIQQHPHLQCLRLDGAMLTDASLDAMTVSLHDFRRLILSRVHGISSAGVRRWMQHCQRLMSVELRQCDHIVASDVVETHHGDDRGCLYLNDHAIANMRRAQRTGQSNLDDHWIAVV